MCLYVLLTGSFPVSAWITARSTLACHPVSSGLVLLPCHLSATYMASVTSSLEHCEIPWTH